MVSGLRAAVIVTTAALVLTACTGESEPPATPPSSTSSEPTPSPTPGTLVGRDAFALTLPKGWTDQEDAGGALLLGISDQTTDGYPMNVHVVADTTLTSVTPEQLEGARKAALDDAGITDVTAQGDFEVDGEQGTRLRYTQDVKGVEVLTVEITATHGDSGFIVAFSFAPSVARAERDAVITNVMDSWTWAQ